MGTSGGLLLNELKEKNKTRIVVLCTVLQNPEKGTPVADFMNVIRSLIRSNPGELRLMHLENTLRMSDHLTPNSDGIQGLAHRIR